MTLSEARRVKAGTRLLNYYARRTTAVATGPAIIDGLKWKIPVDVETSHCEDDGTYYITGLKGHCWDVVKY